VTPPTVLALHGITSTGRAWDAVARELGDRARVLAPDQRGRGDAGDLPGPYGVARHAQDAVELLDREGVERAVVAGHSMGAYVAARMAADHPDRVEAVVLVDGGLPLPVPEDADPDAVLDATLGPAIERLSTTFPDLEAHRAFWRRHPAFAGPEVRDDDLAAWADHDLTGEPPQLRSNVREEAVRADGRDLLMDHDTRSAIERVRAPGLLLRAERGLLDDENAFIPAGQAENFSHPTIELREVPGTNHYTIVMGRTGAPATAAAISELLP
jgi:pimeloyl-ACP methyl ester carboxylesterase